MHVYPLIIIKYVKNEDLQQTCVEYSQVGRVKSGMCSAGIKPYLAVAEFQVSNMPNEPMVCGFRINESSPCASDFFLCFRSNTDDAAACPTHHILAVFACYGQHRCACRLSNNSSSFGSSKQRKGGPMPDSVPVQRVWTMEHYRTKMCESKPHLFTNILVNAATPWKL